MPCKTTTDFHITVQNARKETSWMQVVLEGFIEWANDNCKKYAYAKELNSSGETWHFHLALVLRSPQRSDHFKRRMLHLIPNYAAMDEEEQRHCIAVTCPPNIAGVAGGYLRKEAIEFRNMGFTDEELDAGAAERDKALRDRSLRSVSKSKLGDVLAPFIERAAVENGYLFAPSGYPNNIMEAGIRACMQEGYNIIHHYPVKHWGTYMPAHIVGLRVRGSLGDPLEPPSVAEEEEQSVI